MNNYYPPCIDWAEKLALRSEDLSQAECEALDAHVAVCSACLQAQVDYYFLDVALSTLPDSVVKPLSPLSFLGEERGTWEEDSGEEARLLPLEQHSSLREPSLPSRQTPRGRRQPSENLFHKPIGKLFLAAVAACILVLCFHTPVNKSNEAKSSGISLYTYYEKYNNTVSTVSAVAWSPNGQYIAIGSWDHTIQVLDAKSHALIRTYTGHSGLINTLAWSPDGVYIASGSADTTVQLWNVSTGKTLVTYRGHSAGVSTLAWSLDGREIASGSWDHSVQIWQSLTGQHILTYAESSEFVNTLAWSPGDQEIASGGSDAKVRIWNAGTGVTRLTYPYTMGGDPVDALAWSPDGQKIALGGRDATVKVYDAAAQLHGVSTTPLLTYKGHNKEVDALVWSPDGQYIASGSYDTTVQVWNAKTGAQKLIYTGHSDTVDALAWSPLMYDKKIVSGSWDNTAQIWSIDAP